VIIIHIWDQFLSEMIVIVLLYLRLVNTVTCLDDNDSEHDCRMGEECVPSSQCYDFTRLKNLSPNTAIYNELLLTLKSKVCNKKLKKICCGVFQLNHNNQIECKDDTDCPGIIPDPENSTVTTYSCQKPFQSPKDDDPSNRGHITEDPDYMICVEKIENICCSEHFNEDPKCEGKRRQGTCKEIFGGHPISLYFCSWRHLHV